MPDGGRAHRRAAQGGGRHRPRQDQHARVRRGRQHLQRGLRRHAQPVEPGADLRRLERRRRPSRWRPAWARSPRAPTSAARSARRRPSAASSASAPRPGLVPYYPKLLGWDSLGVTGPMARTVADTALMLSVDGGSRRPRAASPTTWTRRAFLARRQGAVDQGLARGLDARPQRPDPRGRGGRARGRGARPASSARSAPRSSPPAATSARSTTSCSARAGSPWSPTTPTSCRSGRSRCRRGSSGTSSRASRSRPRTSRRAETLRTTLWHRVRAFMETRDLLILPTVAVPPFPVEQPYPTEINGKPLDNYTQWFFLTYGITRHRRCPSSRCPAASPGAACRWGSRSWGGGGRRRWCCARRPPSRPRRPGRTRSRPS